MCPLICGNLNWLICSFIAFLQLRCIFLFRKIKGIFAKIGGLLRIYRDLSVWWILFQLPVYASVISSDMGRAPSCVKSRGYFCKKRGYFSNPLASSPKLEHSQTFSQKIPSLPISVDSLHFNSLIHLFNGIFKLEAKWSFYEENEEWKPKWVYKGWDLHFFTFTTRFMVFTSGLVKKFCKKMDF